MQNVELTDSAQHFQIECIPLNNSHTLLNIRKINKIAIKELPFHPDYPTGGYFML